MIQAPLPFNKENYTQLIKNFENDNATEIELHWWWEPFHRAGFEALKFAAENNFSEEKLELILDDLSATSAPAELKPALTQLKGLDADDRIKSLDPSIRIRKTLEVLGEDWKEKFKAPTFILPIDQLTKDILKASAFWTPDVSQLAEWRVVSKWLTPTSLLLKRFQRLSAWDQLVVIECICGSIISSSKLVFQRVYTP